MFSGFSPLSSVTKRRVASVHGLVYLYLSPPIHLQTERDTISEKWCSARNSRQGTKSRSQVILGTKCHRRNSSQLTKTTAQKLNHWDTSRHCESLYPHTPKSLKSCCHLALMWQYILIIPDTKNRRHLLRKQCGFRQHSFLARTCYRWDHGGGGWQKQIYIRVVTVHVQ
jgi:hypothetical protein